MTSRDVVRLLAAFFQVVKMKHPGSGLKKDRPSVIYNHNFTIRNRPDAFFESVSELASLRSLG